MSNTKGYYIFDCILRFYQIGDTSNQIRSIDKISCKTFNQRKFESFTVFYKSGIYAIINQANGKVYIGQSVKTYSRLNGHKRQLRNNTHCNKQLQSDYQANPKQFIFKVLFQCPPDELNYYEALMIQEAMKQGFEVYNIIKNPFKDLAIQIEERKQGYEEFTGSNYEDVKVKMVKHWLSC